MDRSPGFASSSNLMYADIKELNDPKGKSEPKSIDIN